MAFAAHQEEGHKRSETRPPPPRGAALASPVASRGRRAACAPRAAGGRAGTALPRGAPRTALAQHRAAPHRASPAPRCPAPCQLRTALPRTTPAPHRASPAPRCPSPHQSRRQRQGRRGHEQKPGAAALPRPGRAVQRRLCSWGFQ